MIDNDEIIRIAGPRVPHNARRVRVDSLWVRAESVFIIQVFVALVTPCKWSVSSFFFR